MNRKTRCLLPVLACLVMLVTSRAWAAEENVSLSVTEATLVKGTEKVIRLQGTEEKVKWSSSKKSVAAVSTSDGVTRIIAKKYGKAVITAEVSGKAYTCSVTVVDPRADKDSVYLLTGDDITIHARRVTGTPKWSSADTSVATVNSSGRIRAKAVGNTVIRMKVHGVTVEVPVTVARASLSASTLQMKQGETRRVQVSGNAKTGTWSSADAKRVAVYADGTVEALRHGEVMLTYTVGDSTRTCDVIVQKKNAESTFALTPVQFRSSSSSLRSSALGEKTRYRFLQGSCTDGKNGYYILEDYAHNGKCALIKIRLSDGKILKKKAGLRLGHGNDMTWNEDLGRLVVVHNVTGSTSGARRLSYVNPDTLKITGKVTLDQAVYAIAYNAKGKRYVCGVSGGREMVIKDASFTTMRKFRLLPTGAYTRQGLDCTDKYIFAVQSCLSASKTRILVYDWNGYYVTTINLKGCREAESLFHAGKRYFLGCNSASYDGGQIYETSLVPYYQVRYRANGGSGIMEPRMVKAGKGGRLAPLGYHKTGYTFRGWQMQRASDGKYCCRNSKTGKLRWISKEKISGNWGIYMVPNRCRLKALTKLPGDVILLTAIWKS